MAKHKVSRVLRHRPEQLFELAADVERYPDYLPWWVAARVRKAGGSVYYTDQVLALGILRVRFSSRTVLRHPQRIDVTSTDRPFRHFKLTWLFEPVPEGGCRVSLLVDLKLRSALLGGLLERTVSRVAGRIVSAFEARARQLYGASSASSNS